MTQTLDIQLGIPPAPVDPAAAHPDVVVILLTYGTNAERTDYMRATVASVRERLKYLGNLLWYVADDGSAREHLDAVQAALAGAPVLGWHSERRGYGYNATKAWYMALQHCDVTLFLEDDWIVRYEQDITPWVDTLVRHDDIGMVRLAHLPVGLCCDTVGYDGRHYLRMNWGSAMAFSGNPALRHRRAREAWGAYPEGLRPGDTELVYDAQVRQRRGPGIVWPVDVGGWGLFGHIGARQSYQ
jgi:hypothetical protein